MQTREPLGTWSALGFMGLSFKNVKEVQDDVSITKPIMLGLQHNLEFLTAENSSFEQK